MATVIKTIDPITLTVATRTQISSSAVYCSSIIIYADPDNTGKIYWGDSTVTTTNGIPLAGGQSQNITFDMVFGVNGKIDLSTLYLTTETSTNKARIVYLRWDGL